jgi:hypothetical protein
MNSNNTLILGIAGGSIAMVILGLIIYNVTGNTGDDGKGISQVLNNNNGVNSFIPYGNEETDPEVAIAKQEVGNYTKYDDMENNGNDPTAPRVGGKTKRRRSMKTKHKKRKTQKKKHKKIK